MITTARQLQAAALFVARGYSPAGAAALVGNFCVESGPTLPTAFRTGKLDHGSQGLAQWRVSRLIEYQGMVAAKHPGLTEQQLWPWYGRLDYQVEFVVRELERDYKSLNAKLKQAGDAAALAADVCWQYERPNKALSHIADRIAYAKGIMAASPKKAAQADITVALAAEAAQHDKNHANGRAVTGTAAVLGGATVLTAVAPQMHTWHWVVLAIVAFIALAGIVNMVVSKAASSNVKSAIGGVDTAPPTPATAAAFSPVVKEPEVDQAALAAAGEAEAIKAAEAGKSDPTPSPGASTGPIMSIGKSS